MVTRIHSFRCTKQWWVRPHIKYANNVWSPFLKGNIEYVEKVQKRATKLIISLKHLTCKEKLKQLNFPTLIIDDLEKIIMIEVY